MMADQGSSRRPSQEPDAGRVHQGDVITAVEARSGEGKGAAVPAAKAPSVPSAPSLHHRLRVPEFHAGGAGSRPEQRVPMSRLRRGWPSASCNRNPPAAILTTFNEINMQPILDLRNKYKERFEKEHGVKLGFMGFFVKAVCTR
jgi:2-oxoglutarate dehydrogenase E2 component (dihydrolipoamide succinyltransferase)